MNHLVTLSALNDVRRPQTNVHSIADAKRNKVGIEDIFRFDKKVINVQHRCDMHDSKFRQPITICPASKASRVLKHDSQ